MKIVIPGRFHSLNEYIAANRRGAVIANRMKKKDQAIICHYIPHRLRFHHPIFIEYTYYEPNTKRDKDNISGYFHKVFQDALVQSGCIENDGWKNIMGMADRYAVDKEKPRVEVIINE